MLSEKGAHEGRVRVAVDSAEALVIGISAEVNRLGFERLEVNPNPHAMRFYEHMGFVVTVLSTPGSTQPPECRGRPGDPQAHPG